MQNAVRTSVQGELALAFDSAAVICNLPVAFPLHSILISYPINDKLTICHSLLVTHVIQFLSVVKNMKHIPSASVKRRNIPAKTTSQSQMPTKVKSSKSYGHR